MDTTNIEWCDSTFNPWIGCSKISPACDNCYAEAMMDKRLHFAEWGPGKPRRRTSEKNWSEPTKWNREPFYECGDCGWRGETISNCPSCASEVHSARRRVFCASIADVFDNEVPWQWRLDLFGLIRDTPNIDWLLLTKRVGNVKSMLNEIQVHGELGDVFPNVWLGATICNQEEADRDIPKLLDSRASIRFLSIEPMLGPIDLERIAVGGCGFHASAFGGHHDDNYYAFYFGVDWVIVGGESGKDARPMHPQWVRDIRDQCNAVGVPFLFKQWGEHHSNYRNITTGEPVHLEYSSYGHWQLKPSWAIGKALLIDKNGRVCKNGKDMMDAAYPVAITHRTGKKKSGRRIDGLEWNEFPGQR